MKKIFTVLCVVVSLGAAFLTNSAFAQCSSSTNWQEVNNNIFETCGSVGVGTNAPNTLLDVNGGVFTVGGSGSNFGTANRLQLELYNLNAGQSVIRSYNRATSAYGDIGIGELGKFIVAAGGNVGINNSGPNTLLDVNGGVLTVGGTGSSFGTANRLQLELYNANTGQSIIRSYNRGVAAYGDVGIGELARFIVQGSTGYVGIGTATPAYTLDVNGTIHATNVIGASYQDLAEWVPSSGALPAGTVVVLDAEHNNHVKSSEHAYDTAVAGVVSDHPGIELGEPSASKSRVATTGRVKVRADASKHPIAIGDLLVTSDVAGTVMVSEPVDLGGVKIHRPGTLVGKALEPLQSGKGEILVLLSLQ